MVGGGMIGVGLVIAGRLMVTGVVVMLGVTMMAVASACSLTVIGVRTRVWWRPTGVIIVADRHVGRHGYLNAQPCRIIEVMTIIAMIVLVWWCCDMIVITRVHVVILLRCLRRSRRRSLSVWTGRVRGGSFDGGRKAVFVTPFGRRWRRSRVVIIPISGRMFFVGVGHLLRHISCSIIVCLVGLAMTVVVPMIVTILSATIAMMLLNMRLGRMRIIPILCLQIVTPIGSIPSITIQWLSILGKGTGTRRFRILRASSGNITDAAPPATIVVMLFRRRWA